MAKFTKKNKPTAEIPTASMSDVAFIILLFFMVTTVFVTEDGLKVTLPQAKAIDKIQRKMATTIYVDRLDRISIDDFIIDIPNVRYVMMRKLALNYNTVTCFRTDKNTGYGLMADIMNQLREANALRVSFEAKLKR
ncbi:MAG: biopolymer transporter ExbD [Candidatus Cloacimonadota bacterium]|nr:MAG: biopolymer transporter ExbD [Candidatus Cloacimonadota bacterium]